MERMLFLLHTENDGSLPRPGRETLSAGVEIAASLGVTELSAGLVGQKTEKAAGAVAGAGVANILSVEGEAFGQPRYFTDAAAAEELCRQAGATVVLAPGTSRWNRVLPGVAFRLEGHADTHICEMESDGGQLIAKRWYYRQRMQGTLTRQARPWFLLLEPGSFKPWQGVDAPATLTRVACPVAESALRTKVTGVRQPAEAEQTIRPDAELLLVAGAGWTKTQQDGQVHVKEAEQLILDFLRRTKSSLGGSKSSVDLSSEGQACLSFMTHLHQVGQTGSTPRHAKGLATCCHGEEPHVVGWRFVNDRRAINLNPNCGWAQGKADVLYVADAFEVLAKVNKLLSSE